MSDEIPTPRTDKAKFKILSSLQSGTDDVVHAWVAQELEQELHLAKIALKEAFDERCVLMSAVQYNQITSPITIILPAPTLLPFSSKPSPEIPRLSAGG